MLRLAWRNVRRNLRRSVITVASMGCGLAAIMFDQSLMHSQQRQLIERATSSYTGHLQIQNRSIVDYKFPDRYIGEPDRVAAILAGQAGIEAFARRINVTGMVSSPAGSAGVLICAVEPALERRISSIAGYITEGEYLGRLERGVVMGDKLARRLGLLMNQKAVVLTQTETGSLSAQTFRLVGTFHTGSLTFDSQIVYVPLAAGQSLLASGERVNQFVVRLQDIGRTQSVATQLAEKLGSQPVQVLRWSDIAHEVVGIQKFQNGLLRVLLLVIFIIVALGVANTLFMSLFERMREFGVLKAMGAEPGWIVKLVLAEALLLAAVGVVLGLAGGCALIVYYGHVGVSLAVGDALSYFLPFPPVIYLRFSWTSHALAAVCVLATSLAAAVAPALRACRLNPAEALRHV